MKNRRLIPCAVVGFLALLAGPARAGAQDVIGWSAATSVGTNVDVQFMAGPMGAAGEPVTGAPYSAEAVTEVVQPLADGNRIVHETRATVYRDSEGRTRREQGLAVIGNLVGGPEQHQQVQITDPKAGAVYMLDIDNRTARKLSMPKFNITTTSTVSANGATFTMPIPPPPPPPPPGPGTGPEGAQVFFRSMIMPGSNTPPVVTQLGKQVIEGVEADGVRSTMTIPAGAIGNDRPIEIVSERWFSAELKTLIQSKQSDPRFGDTTYRLTNIVRAEPPAQLFEPPADFRLIEPDANGNVIYHLEQRR